MIRILLLCLAASACSRSKLVEIPPDPPPPRDDRITIKGDFCTRSPGELAFPLRVLFVVDVSDSMAVTDPPDEETGESRRVTAVRAAWTEILEDNPFAKIGILPFSSNAQSRTTVLGENGLPVSYFTRDEDTLETATLALQETERTTNYLNALDESYFEMRTEMREANEEDRQRSRYVVIFLSDGLPDDGGTTGRQRQGEAITETIRRMRDLKNIFGVREIVLHTAYLASDQGSLADAPAEALLTRMSDAGGGTFRSFASGEGLDFLQLASSSLKRLFNLASLVVFNGQMVRDKGQIPDSSIPWFDTGAYKDLAANDVIDCSDPLIDTDGDGLADLIEERIGTDPLDPDTDGDGLRDRIEWNLAISGLDPLDPTDSGCYTPRTVAEEPDCTDTDEDGLCDCNTDDNGRCLYLDDDGDGLNNCEEVFIGTSQSSVDTDVDGIPDPVEYRFQTDAVRRDDIGDLDWDLTPNGVELRTGGNPQCDDADVRSRVAYDYQIREQPVGGETTCYSFRVGGVTLLPTRDEEALGGLGRGRNRILVFAGEQSFDEPNTFAGWRIACLEGAYSEEFDRKTPLSGVVNLKDEDFVPAEEFDPSQCVNRP